MKIILVLICLGIAFRAIQYGNVVGKKGNKKGKYAIWTLILFLLGPLVYLLWFKQNGW